MWVWRGGLIHSPFLCLACVLACVFMCLCPRLFISFRSLLQRLAWCFLLVVNNLLLTYCFLFAAYLPSYVVDSGKIGRGRGCGGALGLIEGMDGWLRRTFVGEMGRDGTGRGGTGRKAHSGIVIVIVIVIVLLCLELSGPSPCLGKLCVNLRLISDINTVVPCKHFFPFFLRWREADDYDDDGGGGGGFGFVYFLLLLLFRLGLLVCLFTALSFQGGTFCCYCCSPVQNT